MPLTNGEIKVSDKVIAIGLKAPKIYRTKKKGLKILCPRHFGFDIDYIPIEKRLAIH
jgi:DUF917 family protein